MSHAFTEPEASRYSGSTLDAHLARINQDYLIDEYEKVTELLSLARTSNELTKRIYSTAKHLVSGVREKQYQSAGVHALLQHYDLSSQEGVVLMCLAEALLRIPDKLTSDELIADKLIAGNWREHLGRSDSLFVNASTWALMLTGKVIKLSRDALRDPEDYLTRFLAQMEEPVLRAGLRSAIRIIAHQFVIGRSIDEALRQALSDHNARYRFSFDMLGEAALSVQDAERYMNAYVDAISAIGATVRKHDDLIAQPSISIKLSALHPRYEPAQKERVVKELANRLMTLAGHARKQGIGLTVDAEESHRLELSLRVFAAAFVGNELAGWDGMGLAVQAYQKRALAVLGWLNQFGAAMNRVIPVRLVKGAYWDTEIKQAQEQGLRDFPVFTRKSSTDVSYLACVRYLFSEGSSLYPQFATHNAHTLSYVYHHSRGRQYEFQRLYGMGEELYGDVIGSNGLDIPCRVYAPVGAYEDLLPYLVRRLLENGANTSFVNQIVHRETTIDDVIADPVAITEDIGDRIRHPHIRAPRDLFLPDRINSAGINFAADNELQSLLDALRQTAAKERAAQPRINGTTGSGHQAAIINPAQRNQVVGTVVYADADTVRAAIDAAEDSYPQWEKTSAIERAGILDRAADLYETQRADLVGLCVREAGKTIKDAHDDVREAVDFLRYYAVQCRERFATPIELPGPDGESNQLSLRGRGIFLCISPWNFPVAIFTGQIGAALAAGNSVIAKPAEQTSLVADRATQLLYEAGVPEGVISFLPGDGDSVGRIALADERVTGVAFTGSTDTAQIINRALAERNGPLATLIAETGGLNAMLVDSSAMLEQVVLDVTRSAFNSAGQRCSALRVLFVQEDIAKRLLNLLFRHLDELVVGDPMQIDTDVGPVIDETAHRDLESHIAQGRLLYRCRPPTASVDGYFVSPAVLEIDSMRELGKEVFGPVLHVVRYPADQLDQVIDDINGCRYGLTFGIHSRIEQRVEEIRQRLKVGNIYVNRNMVGAVVGVQPFGGLGLSGTGPKTGGPHYLLRFAYEQTCTINTAAVGGNASLLVASKTPS
jgi:RHH-type proline utilization regulon transcriptional repressor/proline dehydrogenase/delta 1-pyrroline-5-carboxylate dehydrogenase